MTRFCFKGRFLVAALLGMTKSFYPVHISRELPHIRCGRGVSQVRFGEVSSAVAWISTNVAPLVDWRRCQASR
jgi:hypothetical protein